MIFTHTALVVVYSMSRLKMGTLRINKVYRVYSMARVNIGTQDRVYRVYSMTSTHECSVIQ